MNFFIEYGCMRFEEVLKIKIHLANLFYWRGDVFKCVFVMFQKLVPVFLRVTVQESAAILRIFQPQFLPNSRIYYDFSCMGFGDVVRESRV